MQKKPICVKNIFMNIETMITNMRTFYRSGQTRPLRQRLQALRQLQQALIRHEASLLEALQHDLGKSAIEAYSSEIGFVQTEINFALKHLPKWIKRKKRPTPIFHYPAKSFIQPEPKGAVLIIGPWNYPLGLILTPLVGALAAGNTVVIKPSEFAPQSAQAIKRMLDDTFPSDHCQVQIGDEKLATQLLAQPWDHIFFTGSTQVGRLVMQAAAKTLSPVTLELGGKCPCIVTEDVNLKAAAERIVWGKYLNSGQTCVAPDHVWVPTDMQDQLIDQLNQVITRFYGLDPAQCPDYSRIVNHHHLKRLKTFLADGEIVAGGQLDEQTNYFSPTILRDPAANSPVMREEIFGPILPVLSYTNLAELVKNLQSKPRPLALYIFSRRPKVQEQLISALPAGTTAVNDTINQIVTPYLPFGGLGASGMGQYHGQAGFDCFTHYRSILQQTPKPTSTLRYPPYRLSLKMLKLFYKWMLG